MAALIVMVAVGIVLFIACTGTVIFSYWHEWRMAKVRSQPTAIPTFTLTQKLRHLYPETRNLKKDTNHA